MEAGTPDRSRTATDPYNFIEFCSFQHHQGSHNLCGTGGCPALVFIFLRTRLYRWWLPPGWQHPPVLSALVHTPGDRPKAGIPYGGCNPPATGRICGRKQRTAQEKTDRINKMSRRYFLFNTQTTETVGITPFKTLCTGRPVQTCSKNKKDALTASSINLLPKEQGLPVN